MNLVDLFTLLAIAICIVLGMYRGFAVSALKAASFFVSWVVAYLLHPLLSMLLGTDGMLSMLINYTEGTGKLGAADIFQTKAAVTGFSQAQLGQMVDSSDLVFPYNNLVKKALTSQSFANKGLTTIGDYFNTAVANATLNIITFVMIFLIVRIILGVMINAADSASPLPMLKHHDMLLGGMVGALRGCFTCYVLFAFAPIILNILNISAITDYVMSSSIGFFFVKSNFLLLLIRGTI